MINPSEQSAFLRILQTVRQRAAFGVLGVAVLKVGLFVCYLRSV